MIKRFLQKKIVLVSQIVMLALAIIWYMQNKEIEPLITIIGLGTTLIISVILKAKKEKTNTNYSLPRFTPQDGYINNPLYIYSQQDLALETLLETKTEIEALIENYKFQIIEHEAEIKKVKITLKRFEKDIEVINTKIDSIRGLNY